MSSSVFHPRSVTPRLVEALEDSPVVLIHGPRQCGKTTLAQATCAPNLLTGRSNRPGRLDATLVQESAGQVRNHSYFSFDDPVTRIGALEDPMGFVASLPERVILDEVQRVPALFEAIKLSVDRERVPGRFLLTGSTNVLLVPHMSD